MIFTRSVPTRRYKDYTRYRSLLRGDFKNRCAYCLTHEYFMGGEEGFEIDHYRPQKGEYARPDLVTEYSNLYWSCRTCNGNKADTWPAPEDEAAGLCYIDPCTAEGDHDRHWLFLPDGTIQALTLAGEYTKEKLLLWRPFLRDRRKQQFDDQEEAENIRKILLQKGVEAEKRADIEKRLAEIQKRLEPPIFDRARRGDRPMSSQSSSPTGA